MSTNIKVQLDLSQKGKEFRFPGSEIITLNAQPTDVMGFVFGSIAKFEPKINELKIFEKGVEIHSAEK
jgi:hypothetical protein